MAMGSDHRPDTKATPHVPHGWHGLYLEVVPLAPKSPSLGEAGCRWTLCIRYTQRPDSAACFCPTVNPSDIEVLRSAYSYICECDQGRLDNDQPQSGRLFFYVPRLLVVQNSSRPLSLQPFQLRVDSERVRVSGGGGESKPYLFFFFFSVWHNAVICFLDSSPQNGWPVSVSINSVGRSRGTVVVHRSHLAESIQPAFVLRAFRRPREIEGRQNRSPVAACPTGTRPQRVTGILRMCLSHRGNRRVSLKQRVVVTEMRALLVGPKGCEEDKRGEVENVERFFTSTCKWESTYKQPM